MEHTSLSDGMKEISDFLAQVGEAALADIPGTSIVHHRFTETVFIVGRMKYDGYFFSVRVRADNPRKLLLSHKY
jgi:hypothetical protein